jgi:tetratricopeptide (TPR) repeat protein
MIAGLLAWAVLAGGAQAETWLKAESPHFVIYSSAAEGDVRDYVQMLEDFDALLRTVHGRKVDEPVSQKLTIFLVESKDQLHRVFPEARPGIVGEYQPLEEGIFAIATLASKQQRALDPTRGDDTMLHEYTHHFMLQYYPNAYPSWLVEGYAEYFMTADLRPDVVKVGNANAERVRALMVRPWIPIAEILSKDTSQFSDAQMSSYYAESWLLTHYIMEDYGRRQGVGAFVRAISNGEAPLAAWSRIFPKSPAQMDTLLQSYLHGTIEIDLWKHDWPARPVTISRLPKTEGDIILDAQLIKRSVAPPLAAKALDNLRAETRWGNRDPVVRIALAEAECKFGDRDKAATILKEVIGADPNNSDAMRTLAICKILQSEKDTASKAALYKEANGLLTAALKLDPQNFQTLYRLTQTQSLEPGFPSQATLDMLTKAVSLAPQLPNMRVTTAQIALRRGDINLAKTMLNPVAGNPHGGPAAERARTLLAALNRIGKPDPVVPISPAAAVAQATKDAVAGAAEGGH